MDSPGVCVVLFLFGVLAGGFAAVCWMSVRDGERHAEEGQSAKPNVGTHRITSAALIDLLSQQNAELKAALDRTREGNAT